MSKEIQLRRITRWTLWFAAIWVVLNLPFGFLELYGRTKGVFNYPTTSVGESEREGVLLKDMRDSVDFEGAIEGAAFDEAWIEKNRKLEFVVSLVPFLWSLDFWPPG